MPNGLEFDTCPLNSTNSLWVRVELSWRVQRVGLIFAGWLPQDGAFGSERHACLASSVAGIVDDGCS